MSSSNITRVAFIAFIILIGNFHFTQAQFPSISWVHTEGGLQADKVQSMAMDPQSGDVYVAGQFSDSSTFGNTTLVAQGFIDGFLAKYNSSGVFQWVKQVSSSNAFGDVQLRAVTVDGNGDVILSGSYFQGANVGGQVLTGPGDINIFVAKFNNQGTVTQAVKFGSGGIFPNEAFSIAADDDNNLYMTGVYVETVPFGAFTLSSPTSESSFLVKLSSGLSPLWARSMGDATFSSKGRGVAVSGDKVVVCGGFDTQITVNGQNHSAAGSVDAYIVQFDTAGTFQWFESGGGNGNDEALSVSMDESGNSYVGGYYTGVASFGGSSTSTQASENAYIVSYTPSGSLNWLRGPKSRGVNGSSRTNSVSYFNNNIHIAGNFADSLSFTTFGISAPPGGNAGFLSHYNTGGTATNALPAGLELLACATYGDGGFFGGHFAGTESLDGNTLVSVGDLDVMVFRTEPFVGVEDGNLLTGQLQVFPNPMQGAVSIVFTHPVHQEVTIQMLDLKGSIIRTIYQGELSAGETTFSMDATSLPAVVHFLVATYGSEKTILRTIKVN